MLNMWKLVKKFIPNFWEGHVSPVKIAHLRPNQIFVFGSMMNWSWDDPELAQARLFGASSDIKKGLSGNTYAIPTRFDKAEGNFFAYVDFAVEDFLNFAIQHPELEFILTELCCKPEEIVPLFYTRNKPDNVKFPESWLDYIVTHG